MTAQNQARVSQDPDVLVLQAARLGDLVQSKRLILSLATRAKVHLGVDHGLAGLASLLYPDVQIHALSLHGAPHPEALAENRRVFQDWADISFAEIYNCNFSPLTAALSRLFPPEAVFGYRPASDSQGGLLRSPWVRLAFRISRNRRLSSLNLVDYWAFFAQSLNKPSHRLKPEDVNPRAKPGGQGLGVVLAGREARRSLPIPVLASIVETVFKILDGPRVRLLGSRAEQPLARALLRHLASKVQQRAEDLSGKTDLPGLYEAINGLDALISPDTGVMHLAAHLGVPVLAFFLSSAWAHETGPYGYGHHIWQAVTECAPCLESAPCPCGLVCHKAFESPFLARSLAFVLHSERLPEVEMPTNLQIWATSFDDLGCRLKLCAGNDEYTKRRKACRAIAMESLGLDADVEWELSPQEQGRLRRELMPDCEWMLPTRRYA